MSAPAIRFPDESGEWSEASFDEACRTVSVRGHQLQAHAFEKSGDLPVVDQGASLIAGYTDDHDLRFTNLPVIVFGDHTTNLKYIDFPFVVGADGTKLIQPINADPRFLYYTLLRNNVEQEGYKRHFSILREKTLNFPSLPEQRRIADALSAVDAKIDLLGRKRDALVRFKAGLMQKLFSQEVRFTREDGSSYEDLKTVRIGDISTWIRSNSLSRDNLTSEAGEIQNIHYGDIHTKYPTLFRQNEHAVPCVVNGALRIVSNEQFCRPGDLVIADASEDVADVGKTIEIVEATPDSLVAGLHTHLCRPDNGVFAPGYAGYMMGSRQVRLQIERVTQGTKVFGISKRNIADLLVRLPSIPEQRHIVDVLVSIDSRIVLLDRNDAAMQAFKKGLLQQMFV